MMANDVESELKAAVEAVLESKAARKLIVSGPGAGKTTIFKRILEASRGTRNGRLILTFINSLKNELDEKLSSLAQVFTFHGYCRSLLHRRPQLRGGLSDRFEYYPPLANLIISDWRLAFGEEAPHFIRAMQQLVRGEDTNFYLMRSDYYDAVSFDDSVFRVHETLRSDPDSCESFELVVIDEYQDFNRLEASFIEMLAAKSPIVIAGDDDQALYSQLKGSSPEFIRALHVDPGYENFELPFCMRCTETVVGAVGDMVNAAQRIGRLQGRIEKAYRFYPPRKGKDSIAYPHIRIVQTSVQSLRANYFGRFIVEAISRIPTEEIAESRQEGFPTVLIIGPRQYLSQIERYLTESGLVVDSVVREDVGEVVRDDGLQLVQRSPEANLGWRILLEWDRPIFLQETIVRSVMEQLPLVRLLPDEYRERIRAEVDAFAPAVAVVEPRLAPPANQATIRLSSFEGSKGLSAQHVFIVGLQEGSLPANGAGPTDLEICKFIVALTRARKQGTLMYTTRWSGNVVRPSMFLDWIDVRRVERIRVDAQYWRAPF